MGTATYFADDEDQLFELNSPAIQPWLGIDHANKALRNRNRYATVEKAIKIFNWYGKLHNTTKSWNIIENIIFV